MDAELTPEAIREAEFRTALRGADREQVTEFLARAADAVQSLAAERDKLAARLEEGVGRDLEAEFEALGREVSAILEAAREAAEAMRERASLDAVSWRAEAREESETQRREAAADAEALRRDAWATGTELLQQAAADARRMREEAERDVLTVMGEAEREAHRLTSSARREAEDLLRNATMEAERIAADSARRREEIIDQASRQAAAAQERTRALEQRRDELLEELENVRATLSRLEGSLDERREALQAKAQEPSSVRVVPKFPPQPETQTAESWEVGETVRVVRSGAGDEDEAQRIADEVSADLVRIREHDTPVREEPEPGVEEARVLEPAGTKPTPEPKVEPEPAPEPVQTGGDDVEALFQSLRSGGGDVEAEASEPDSEPEPERTASDWIEERDSRLLPITNRALRGVKKAVTDLQNIALDHLRTDQDWRPSPDEIAETLRGELITVWSESFAAGYAAAEASSGEKLIRPSTPHTEAAEEFAAGLARAVTAALDESGGGQRERQTAASRVYRVWRTDEGERRVRELAMEAYQIGMERSLPASTGAES